MKAFLLVFVTMVSLYSAMSQNIPVKTEQRGTAFVEPDELLEVALQNSLRSEGIREVDVDRLHDHDNSAFKIEIKSIGILGPDFVNTLKKVLTSDLGFSGVTVKARDPWRHGHDDEVKYVVFLNPSSSEAELEALAQKTMKTSFLELDDDPW